MLSSPPNPLNTFTLTQVSIQQNRSKQSLSLSNLKRLAGRLNDHGKDVLAKRIEIERMDVESAIRKGFKVGDTVLSSLDLSSRGDRNNSKDPIPNISLPRDDKRLQFYLRQSMEKPAKERHLEERMEKGLHNAYEQKISKMRRLRKINKENNMKSEQSVKGKPGGRHWARISGDIDGVEQDNGHEEERSRGLFVLGKSKDKWSFKKEEEGSSRFFMKQTGDSVGMRTMHTDNDHYYRHEDSVSKMPLVRISTDCTLHLNGNEKNKTPSVHVPPILCRLNTRASQKTPRGGDIVRLPHKTRIDTKGFSFDVLEKVLNPLKKVNNKAQLTMASSTGLAPTRPPTMQGYLNKPSFTSINGTTYNFIKRNDTRQ